ncbi:MAG: coenzyme F420-0:L-glutamate ligase [Patescibacteria group bacterium]
MIITPIKTRIFQEGENLFKFITDYFKKISEGSVIVVTSKIVALSEKRTAIVKNIRTKEELIRKESTIAIPTKYVWMTIKDNMIMASAGIDESNADGKVILLPKDSFKAARVLRNQLKKKYKIKNLGVVITDSRTVPFRSGVAGVAMGYAGFRGLKDYTGKLDIFGRKFKYAKVNVADCLATSAILVMGEGAERRPLAVITVASVEFCQNVRRKELEINIEDDMYLPLFAKLKKLKAKKASK